MDKSIIIVGAGKGIGLGVAVKFGLEGYKVGIVNRSEESAGFMLKDLKSRGITAYSALADISDEVSLENALEVLTDQLGGVDILHYNAASYNFKDILELNKSEIIYDFSVNVIGALTSTRKLYDTLKKRKGVVLLTGGGLADHPSFHYASLSIGKSAIRSIAHQLNDKLKDDGIYVGTLTVNGGATEDSITHSPKILSEIFWEMSIKRDQIEIIY
jgi:short-subunit dehydrogenase